MRSYKKTYVIITFILLFACLLLIALLPKDKFSEEEKRSLATAPQLTLSNLASGDYMSDLESYMADHFPMRKQLVGVKSYFAQAVSEGDAYMGADDYLFTLPGKFDSDKLNKNIELFNQFEEKTGVRASYMIIPTSAYELNSKLPRVHREYMDGTVLNAVNEGLHNIVDIASLFNEQEGVYYRTDHHWTSYGAYLAYCEYLESVGKNPVPVTEFNKEAYRGFKGTTYSKSGLWLHNSDDIELYVADVSVEVEITESNGNISEHKDMFFRDNLKIADKYTVFLNGTHALVKIRNNDIASDSKLLIVADSYGSSIAPFLALNYKEVYLVDLRYYRREALSELVETENIGNTLVIYGVEHFADDASSGIPYLR